jgi:outer membrane receptor protein involved in Fe transport
VIEEGDAEMIRSILLGSVASVALTSVAGAQTASPAPADPQTSNSSTAVNQATPPLTAPAVSSQVASGGGEIGNDVVVTGSRIVANGFQQPTPVTVLGSAEISRQAPVTIAAYLNKIPSFGGTTSDRNPAINVAGGGTEFVNLRNLGVTRTLVLLDDRRVVESTTAGGVDTVSMPMMLIKRVEVVTGGASAAWGSDAVAGVVNFVLDHDYKGLGINVDTGVSQRGDNGYAKVNVTGGLHFADGKGRLIAEVDYSKTPEGVDLSARSFFQSRAVVNNPNYTPTNGQPRQITISNAAPSNVSPGGVITSGPLRGIQFLGPNGTPAPYNFGTQSGLVQYGGDVDNTVGESRAITAATNYVNVFAHGEYDIFPHVTAYAEGFYGKSNYDENGYLYYLRQGNLPISVDNAYLDPTIRAQLVAQGQTSFNLGKDTVDFGPPTSHNTRDVWRAVVGLNGEIGSSWKWHGYYTHGESTTKLYAYNDTIISNFLNAVDAVRNPATGAIVCRSTLTNPTNGCVPLDVFGVGVASPAAIAYTHGTAYQRSTVKLDVVSADATGTLFALPAGDVSVAFGGDYIKNQAFSTQDALALARAYAVQNFQPFAGQRDVKEGFVETVIPLLKDLPLAHLLELNGAARLTDYSTSGNVVTWKVGLSDQVTHDLRVRGTLSRDIRAPTLTDLFSGGTLTQQPVLDPFTGKTYAQYTNARGNPDLRPEVGSTLTAGIIYSPSFIPGLAVSVDYYRINLRGAITSISAAQELQYCFAGQAQYCQYIHRDDTQAITSIDTVPINAAVLRTKGWDFEVDYRRPIGTGQISLRALANYVPVFTQIDATGNVTNFAGQVGDLNPGEPKFKADVTTTYDQGPFELSLDTHFIGSAKLQNNWVSGVDVDNNSVSSFVTFDLTASVNIKTGRSPLRLSFGVDNLFDRDPIDLPVIPATVQYSAPGLGGRFDLYDPLGRSFRVGLTTKF